MRDEIRALVARAVEDAEDLVRLRGELAAARDHIAMLEADPEIRRAHVFKNRLAEAEAERALSMRAASKAQRDAQLIGEQLEGVRDELRRAYAQVAADA